jgi:hypothetical protein
MCMSMEMEMNMNMNMINICLTRPFIGARIACSTGKGVEGESCVHIYKRGCLCMMMMMMMVIIIIV